VVEDVERSLAITNLDPEALAGVLVYDGHDRSIVALTPEQPHVDPADRAVVELAKQIVRRFAGSGGVVANREHHAAMVNSSASGRNGTIGQLSFKRVNGQQIVAHSSLCRGCRLDD
jgi:hypothetical protein